MRRQVLILLLLAVELILAAVALHVPDLRAAGGFLRGGYPTAVTTLAASALLVWSGLLVAAVVLAVRTVRRLPAGVRSAQAVIGLMLVVGVMVLGVGVAHHLRAPYTMCCGSISQARQQLTAEP